MSAVVTFIGIIPSVAAIALVLIALGLGLSVLTWWFWTTAKPEPVALAPLEIMSGRRYAQANEAEREHMVDSVRGLVTSVERTQRPPQAHPRPERQSQTQRTPRAPIDPLLK